MPTLSFIDMADVLVFARVGPLERRRRVRDLPLPHAAAERAGLLLLARSHRRSRITRRSEWFVTKSPVGHDRRARTIKYMISFALPRFCDQSLDRSRKERFYPGAEPWIAKLDTVVHELYHIDPELARHPPDRARGRHLLRQLPRPAVLRAGRRAWCTTYLDEQPVAGGLRLPARRFRRRSTRARRRRRHELPTFPSFPQRYIERLAEQLPCEADADGVTIEPLRRAQQPTRYTEDDLHVRQFMKDTSRRLHSQGSVQGRVTPTSSSTQFDAAGAEEPRRPVARAEALDAHHAGRARRVHELVAADRDRRRATRPGAVVVKNTRSPGASSLRLDRFPDPKLLPHLARQRDAVLREHVLREAAAVEAASDRCRRCGTACRAAPAPCRSAHSRRSRCAARQSDAGAATVRGIGGAGRRRVGAGRRRAARLPAPPGIGNGRGTAPVEAQAPVSAAASATSDAMARAYIAGIIGRADRTSHYRR